MKLLFAPAAEADLVDIALHIAADDTERALNFVAELQAACNIMQDHPQAGRLQHHAGSSAGRRRTA